MTVRRLDPVQPDSFAFSADNLAWARKIIGNYPPGKQASAVIPVLWRAQEQNDGWVTRAAIESVARMLDMSYIRVLEVATFYTMFQLSPVGRKAHIQVCGTTPCMLRGAEELKKVCQHRIHPEPHHLSADGNFSWEEVECLGACVNAPMVQISKDTYEDLTPQSLEKLIDDIIQDRPLKPGPQIDRQLSAPAGGLTSLTDKALYSNGHKFSRMEPAPPPIPAPAAPPPVIIEAGTATPAARAPKPEDIRPVSKASKAVDAQRAADERTERTAVLPERAQVETSMVRASGAQVVEAPKPAGPARPPGIPELLKKPRSRKGDDLKLIKGVGPTLEKLLNRMGIWHFDQIASWKAAELKWVDERLEGFKGRARRDEWVRQARKLAAAEKLKER